MALDSWLGSGTNAASNAAQASTKYVNVAGAEQLFQSTESLSQRKVKAGTLDRLYVFFSSVSGGGNTTTLRSRINGANGNLAISTPAGTAGWFSDLVNTDDVVDDDLVCLSVTGSAAIYGVNHSGIFGLRMQATDATWNFIGGNPAQVSAANRFVGPGGGRGGWNASENSARQRIKAAGTLDDLHVHVSFNDTSQTTTFTLSKNNSLTALAVSFAGFATGQFEDTTHSVAVASDDYISWKVTGLDWVLQFGLCSMRFVSDDLRTDIFQQPFYQTNQGATFLNPFGYGPLTATENNANGTSPAAFEATWLRCFLDQNGTTGFTLKLRINQVDATNNVISFPASTTGYFEASGDPDTVGSGALLGYVISTANNILGVSTHTALTLEGAAAPPSNFVRESALPILVVGEIVPPVRESALPILVVGEIIPPVRNSALPILVVADAVSCATRFCQCWLFVRQDGEEFAFTSHDEPVPFMGRTFDPCASLFPTATEGATEVGAIGNMELAGIIASDAITEFDLYAGKFDGCYVEVWEVPWDRTTGDVPKRLAAGRTGSVSHGREGFRAEVLGLGAQMQQQAMTQVVSPSCRFRFGDERCGKDLGPLTVAGTVTSVGGPGDRRTFSASGFVGGSPVLSDDYFAQGFVTFTAGANDGVRSHVKSYDAEEGTFVLWDLLPVAPAVGDTFEAVPGCDLSKVGAHGCAFWDNVLNFGGFDEVPGDDAIANTPDAKF